MGLGFRALRLQKFGVYREPVCSICGGGSGALGILGPGYCRLASFEAE